MFVFWRRLFSQRDFYAGAVLILLGLVAVWKASDYGVGTFKAMGPGFMPTALGFVLVLLGLLISGAASFEGETGWQAFSLDTAELRSLIFVLGGPIFFVIFGIFTGFVPAAFSCVFVSSLGHRASTLKSSLVLAVVVTTISVFIFSFLLEVPIPLLKWSSL